MAQAPGKAGEAGDAQVAASADKKNVSFFRMFASTMASSNSREGGLTESNQTALAAVDEQQRRRPSVSSGGSDENQQGARKPPLAAGLRRAGHRCCHPSEATIDVFKQFLHSKIWKLFFIYNAFVLLFGYQIQNLWIPKGGDIACDVLYCCALCFFSIDMVLRLYVEDKYFIFHLCGPSGAWGRCHVGSFLFWCDLLSTLTLLYNISFINLELQDVRAIDLGLNEIGMPTDGLDEINRTLPIETELDLLLLIARAARMARFIRSSTVVETRSRINWYWIFQRLNPCFYIEGWKRRRVNSASSSRSLGDRDGSADSPGDEFSQRSRPSLVRSKSWGGLQVGMIAAARTRQIKVEKTGFHGFFVKTLRFFGVLRGDKEELRRQIAAITIQRAWRQSCLEASGHMQFTEENAWTSTRNVSVRTSSKKSVEKRSMMRLYNHGHFRRLVTSKKQGSTERSAMSTATTRSRRTESQVGSAMRELTGQRVAIGIICALILTVLFTYTENDATRPSSMIVLHDQTQNEKFAGVAINAARISATPDLFEYKFANGTTDEYQPLTGEDPDKLRNREILEITVTDSSDNVTVGKFAFREEQRTAAIVQILLTILVLLCWYFGVAAFAGPLAMLVVIPIERMIRLLGMLMVDPLGYQSTSRYKTFVREEEEITKNTRWTKEVLKGMETSFLMSTILRIGSLMRVGFGSAGVEIIRDNLEKGQNKNMLILNSQGRTVSCIFLFCDIRQFTDATECLQEEVFVFTNRIAAVVHSMCHSYGGSANKNVGDAFLISWKLEEEDQLSQGTAIIRDSNNSARDSFVAMTHQADKALLSVVKIAIALHHDKYYIETLSETARETLLKKLAKRKGPVVQLGFGLHAGKAVQGAIGSQRKIDATYVSESVERAEFLESSTKKYGLKMLMSDSFHRLLHSSIRRRCRKIDQILLQKEDEDIEPVLDGDVMELFTFDMDIDALWKVPVNTPADMTDAASDTESFAEVGRGSKKDGLRAQASIRHAVGGGLLGGPRKRRSVRQPNKFVLGGDNSGEMASGEVLAPQVSGSINSSNEFDDETTPVYKTPEFPTLPTGPAMYNSNVWVKDDMRRIRERYSDGLFFQQFNSGFLAFYSKDWEHAKQCFQTILERFDDGPSRYFLNIIEENNGIPPRNFLGYGTE